MSINKNARKGKVKITKFGDSSQNWFRITTIRIVVQAIIFLLFMSFVFFTSFAYLNGKPGLRPWVSKILEIDPLVAVSTAVTTGTVYKGLLWSLVLIIPTLFLGRFFCNWICPYGTLHQFFGWLFRKLRPRDTIEINRYHGFQHVKYYILIAFFVFALFGSLQIGLLDPICLLHRSFTASLLPAANMPSQSIFGDYKVHQGAWLVGAVIFGLVAMNMLIPRFFCRVLCPLGAFLGVMSRFSLWRIERDPQKCTDCDLCLINCEGASDPHTQLRKSECFVCFNCIEDCPEDALSFAFLPKESHGVTGTDIPRRKAIFATVLGVMAFPFVRSSGASTRDFNAKAIRPPGSVEELEFLERCIKCDQCIRACPTNVLQPSWFETGLEGLWTPVMNFRIGHCQLNCTACGQVCPTGAIQRVSVEEKLGKGEFEKQGPIKLGTAHFDQGRCLPHSKNIPCVVCEEVCPTSPKAIHAEYRMLMVREGKKMVTASSPDTITLAEWPQTRITEPEPLLLNTNQYQGDETTKYYVKIRHSDGVVETHRIVGNDADTLKVEGRFAQAPEHGAVAAIHLEFKVPHIDTELCIGCGLCERECPVVGDRRAVYVTAEGETRSQNFDERDRNRSLRLIKTADARSGLHGLSPDDSAVGMLSLSHMIAGQDAGAARGTEKSGGCGCGSGGGSSQGGCCSQEGSAGSRASLQTLVDAASGGGGGAGRNSGVLPPSGGGNRIDLRKFLG